MADDLAAARRLKERCYAAWHSDPPELLRCAAALAALADAASDDPAGAEVRALAQWTGAIADLVEGRLASALERLDAAHDAFATLGRADDAAQTRVPKIMGLALLGRFDEAIACADAARHALLAQGDRRSAAKVALNTGSLCMQRDRYADAAGHYREAAVHFARVGDREHSVLADVGRADALAYLGDSGEAEALYRRALERARTHGLPVIESAVAQALAELALARGNYREALAGLELASRDFLRLGLPLLRVEAEKALGDAYLELRLLPEAECLYETVLASLAEHEAAATRAWVWLQRARLFGARNELAPALATLARAEQLFGETGNAAGQVAAQLARSELLLAAGTVGAAQDAARAALDGFDRLKLPAAAARLALAEADAAASAPSAAAAALAAFDALLSTPDTPLPLRERAWLGRGRVLRRTGRRAASKAAFASAVELAEAGRLALPGDDFQRAYLDRRAGAYEELLRIALDEHEAAPGDAKAWAVLIATERRRARTLRDRLGPAAAAQERQPEAAAVRAQRARLDWLYRRLNRYLREGDAADAPARLQAERAALEHSLLEDGRRARLVLQRPAQANGSPAAALNPAALHALLSRSTALVTYAELDGELFAVSVARGRVRLHRHLARWADVLAALHALRGQLATQQLGSARLQRHAAQLAERTRRCLARLHLLVWRPLTSALQDAEAVRVVPCGALAGLPFAALWDGSGHLVERQDLLMAASVETALCARAPASDGALTPNARVVAIADTTRLPGAAAEVAALRACWPGARVHTGEGATRAALEAEAASADLLHLACHGEFRADSPLFSALHLHDGALTALDAERLPLATPLVVLSGCETALSDAARDDEALGLVRAFLIAGAGRVLGGLWAVEDAATARWMAAFHARLATGAPPRQALGEVQRGFIAAGEHPYVWAAFVMHGQD